MDRAANPSLSDILAEHSNDEATTEPQQTPSEEEPQQQDDDPPPPYQPPSPSPPAYRTLTLHLPITLHQHAPGRFMPEGLRTPTTNKMLAGRPLSTSLSTIHLSQNASYTDALAFLRNHALITTVPTTQDVRFFSRIAVVRRGRVSVVGEERWRRAREIVRRETGTSRLLFSFAVVSREYAGEGRWARLRREVRRDTWWMPPVREGPLLFEGRGESVF